MDTYQTGDSSAKIKFATDVETWAMARTRALVIDVRSEKVVVSAASADATGDIPRSDLAPASLLNGKLLSVWTEIRLDIFPELEERKRQLHNTSVDYLLEGGVDGAKTFKPDSVVPLADYTKAIISKKIQLIS